MLPILAVTCGTLWFHLWCYHSWCSVTIVTSLSRDHAADAEWNVLMKKLIRSFKILLTYRLVFPLHRLPFICTELRFFALQQLAAPLKSSRKEGCNCLAWSQGGSWAPAWSNTEIRKRRGWRETLNAGISIVSKRCCRMSNFADFQY